MKTALKIFLYILAALGILLLIGAGVIGYYSYKTYHRYFADYTCTSYLKVLDSVVAKLPEGTTEKHDYFSDMDGKMLGMYLTFYMMIRNGSFDNQSENFYIAEDKAIRYANELTTLCRAHPELKPTDIVDPKAQMNDKAALAATNARIDALLKGVPLTTDPTSTLAGKAIAIAFKQHRDMEKLVSSTTASPTTPNTESRKPKAE